MKNLMLVSNKKIIEAVPDVAFVLKLMAKAGVEMEVVALPSITVMMGGKDEKLWIDGEPREWPELVMVGPMLDEALFYPLGAVLRMLENNGAVCVNGSRTLDITRDKLLTYQLAEAAVPDLPVVRTILVSANQTADELIAHLGLPMVLKIAHGSAGKGVTLVETREALEAELKDYAAGKAGDELLAQEAITTSRGRDLRMVVGDGEVLYSYVRVNDNGFRSNVHQGGRIEAFDPPASLVERTIRLAEMAGLKYGSVDYLFGKTPDDFILCELNSMPGTAFLEKAEAEGGRDLLEKFFALPARLLASRKKQQQARAFTR